jgi:hypothetical protein
MEEVVQSSSEKDRSSRFLAGLTASMLLEGSAHPCRAHDLSRNGVLLTGDLPIPEVPEVRVRLTSRSGDLTVSTQARVVHAGKNEDGTETRIGLEFLEIDEAVRNTLEALVSRVVEGMTPAALDDLADNAQPAEIRNALERVPLAHRVALAKRGLPKQRELLFHDTHLQVLDALARNPNLLPHEVVTLLRMPSLPPHTLAALAKDPRWRSHEQVGVMISTHRNTPLPVAEEVVSRLRPGSVQKVLRSPGLHEALKVKLLRRLGRSR